MKPARVHRTALGGFTIDGPYFRRPSRAAVLAARFFHWLGGLTMGRYTEDVDYVPGSVNDHSHASHQPASVGEIGKRSPQNDAAANAALEQARAVLAARNARR